MDISSILDFFKNVQNSQLLILFASGGVLFTVINNAKYIFGSIWNAILSVISFSIHSVVTAEYDIPPLIYKMNKVFSRSRIIWERNSEIQPSSNDFCETKMTKSAFGRSYRILFGKFVVLDREYSMQSTKLAVSITLRVFFARKEKFIKRLMDEIEKCSLKDDRNSVFINMGKGISIEKPKRTIKSIYTKNNVVEHIYNDIKCFLSSKDIYKKNNSPWKYVSLLSGTPGCGKSSAIHAIASEFDMDVRFISLADEDFYDVARILVDSNGSGKRTIIVIEDIDAINSGMTEKRHEKKKYNIPIDDMMSAHQIESVKNLENGLNLDSLRTDMSLSSILNLLDGIITPTGTIIFLTSNHPENLDDAMIRDGRIDSHYEFDNLDKDTANRMIFDNLGFKINSIKDNISPSSLQRDILKVKTDAIDKEEFIKKFSID